MIYLCSRGSILTLRPVARRRLAFEECELRADAAGGVVDDPVLAAAHAR